MDDVLYMFGLLLWRVRCVTELLNIELKKFLERLVMLTH